MAAWGGAEAPRIVSVAAVADATQAAHSARVGLTVTPYRWHDHVAIAAAPALETAGS